MGTIQDTKLVGEFMHPLIGPESTNGDPWKRNYGQPPVIGKLVPRTVPLIDIRPHVSDVPTDLLTSHGFGVVKHKSAIFEPPYSLDDLTEEKVSDVYYNEIHDLVVKATGAKHVFITTSIFRRGKSAPEEYVMPTGLKPMEKKLDTNQTEEKNAKLSEKTQDSKPAEITHIRMGAPVRIPHLDYTHLGARQAIRFQHPGVYKTAVERGVIAAEDKICENHPFSAYTKEANDLIAESYNQNGKLGPRYAAYSVWRPLKKVRRDPLVLAPRKAPISADSDLVYWPYENRFLSPAELGGEYLREFAKLGVTRESPEGNSKSSDFLKWYYLSEQETDEVLIIKLFDSAALGENSQEACAPWHGSPEIGAAADDYARESIDVRVMVFW